MIQTGGFECGLKIKKSMGPKRDRDQEGLGSKSLTQKLSSGKRQPHRKQRPCELNLSQ